MSDEQPSTVTVFCPKGLETPEARQELADLIRVIDQHWDEIE